MTNNMLKLRLNWKRISIIIAIFCFILGFILGKINITFAAGIIYADGTQAQTNQYNNANEKSSYVQGIYESSATPVIPIISNDTYEDPTKVQLTLADGATIPVGTYLMTYHNLIINYASDFNGFIEFKAQYASNNGQLTIQSHTIPVRAGVNTYTIPNWGVKSSINVSMGQIQNGAYNNLKCIEIKKIIIRK